MNNLKLNLELKRYIKLSERTVKRFPKFLDYLWISDFRKKLDSIHASLGIAGEYLEEIIGDEDENNNIDYKEEIGDIMWYVALYIRTHNYDVTKFDVLNIVSPKSISKIIGLLVEHNKKWLIYNKEFDANVHNSLIQQLIYQLNKICESYNLNIIDCMEYNIEKLSIRYPNKFTVADAIERKDKK